MIDLTNRIINRIGRGIDAATTEGAEGSAQSKLRTLLERLTAARAAFLDVAISSRAAAADYTAARAAFLDALISSRASAADYTAARAANLDSLGTTNTRVDAFMSSRLSTAIKTVQYGTISLDSTATLVFDAAITAVVLAKSVVHNLGTSTDAAADGIATGGYRSVRLSLPTTTIVRGTRGIANSGVGTVISFCVVEYW